MDNETAARLDELLDELSNVWTETPKESDDYLSDRFWSAIHKARQIVAVTGDNKP